MKRSHSLNFQLLRFSCIFKLGVAFDSYVIITMQDKPGIRATAELMLIFVWLLFSNGATAQQPYIPFKHYSTVQGLSQNHVIAIHQDSQGFMWFGTLEG